MRGGFPAGESPGATSGIDGRGVKPGRCFLHRRRRRRWTWPKKSAEWRSPMQPCPPPPAPSPWPRRDSRLPVDAPRPTAVMTVGARRVVPAHLGGALARRFRPVQGRAVAGPSAAPIRLRNATTTSTPPQPGDQVRPGLRCGGSTGRRTPRSRRRTWTRSMRASRAYSPPGSLPPVPLLPSYTSERLCSPIGGGGLQPAWLAGFAVGFAANPANHPAQPVRPPRNKTTFKAGPFQKKKRPQPPYVIDHPPLWKWWTRFFS